jgi:hypothetical protein
MLDDDKADFTVTTILSPIEAYLFPVPPNTRITSTSLHLSYQQRRVLILAVPLFVWYIKDCEKIKFNDTPLTE